MHKFQGLVVPIITPSKNNTVDIVSLKKLINFLIKNKTDALFILGTTGEFQNLTLEEKKITIRASAAAIRRRVPLMVGISAPTIQETEQLINLTNKLKVSAVVLAPLFGKGDAGEKINIVIKQSRQPILLYNNPAIHGKRNLDLRIIKKFLTNKKIVGIKDSSGNNNYFNKLLKLSSKNFGVFQGEEKNIMEFLQKNIAGIVSGSANLYPKEFKTLFLQKSKDIMDKISKRKKEIASLSPNYIFGLKIKLAEEDLIETSQLFN